jgi:hypothetical protein
MNKLGGRREWPGAILARRALTIRLRSLGARLCGLTGITLKSRMPRLSSPEI